MSITLSKRLAFAQKKKLHCEQNKKEDIYSSTGVQRKGLEVFVNTMAQPYLPE